MIQQRRSSSTHIHSLSLTAIIHPNHKKKRLRIIHQIPLAGQFFRAFYAADSNLISHGQDLKISIFRVIPLVTMCAVQIWRRVKIHAMHHSCGTKSNTHARAQAVAENPPHLAQQMSPLCPLACSLTLRGFCAAPDQKTDISPINNS
jgi:hypothetical protein